MKLLSALILPIVLITPSATAAPSKLVEGLELTPEMVVAEEYVIGVGAAIACVNKFGDKYVIDTSAAAMGIAVVTSRAGMSEDRSTAFMEHGLDLVLEIYDNLDEKTKTDVCEALVTDQIGKTFFKTK